MGEDEEEEELHVFFPVVNNVIICPSIFLVDLPNPTQYIPPNSPVPATSPSPPLRPRPRPCKKG